MCATDGTTRNNSTSAVLTAPEINCRHSTSDKNDTLTRLKLVTQHPGNQTCVDCPSKRPLWVSFLSVGPEARIAVLCCSQCIRHHYFELGSNLCRIKYTKMIHEWTPENIDTLEKSGNLVVNNIYEANLKDDDFDKEFVLGVEDEEWKRRATFIRNKYKKEKYKQEKYQSSMEGKKEKDDIHLSTNLQRQKQCDPAKRQSPPIAAKASQHVEPAPTETHSKDSEATAARLRRRTVPNPSKHSRHSRSSVRTLHRRRSKSECWSKSQRLSRSSGRELQRRRSQSEGRNNQPRQTRKQRAARSSRARRGVHRRSSRSEGPSCVPRKERESRSQDNNQRRGRSESPRRRDPFLRRGGDRSERRERSVKRWEASNTPITSLKPTGAAAARQRMEATLDH